MNALALSKAIPSEILEEANFQLLIAAEHLRSSVAICKAIAADAKNGGSLIDDLLRLLDNMKETQFFLVADAAKEFEEATRIVGEQPFPASMSSSTVIANGIPLADFALGRHAEAGKNLGVSQTAITKAISARREIYVQQNSGGGYSAYETKPFPSGNQFAEAGQ